MSAKRKTFSKPINTKRMCKKAVFKNDMFLGFPFQEKLGNDAIFNYNEELEKHEKQGEKELFKSMNKSMNKMMNKMMNKINIMSEKIVNIENMLEKDNEKSLKIDDLSYQLNCIKINNEELKYRINKKSDNIDYYA